MTSPVVHVPSGRTSGGGGSSRGSATVVRDRPPPQGGLDLKTMLPAGGKGDKPASAGGGDLAQPIPAASRGAAAPRQRSIVGAAQPSTDETPPV